MTPNIMTKIVLSFSRDLRQRFPQIIIIKVVENDCDGGFSFRKYKCSLHISTRSIFSFNAKSFLSTALRFKTAKMILLCWENLGN